MSITPCIQLQIHWNDEAVVPMRWTVGDGLNLVSQELFNILRVGFDVYGGIPVYIVEENITVRLINKALVIGEKHYKEKVECQKLY